MDALGHQRFAVVGHDTGMNIAYTLAADHPGRVERLAVAEAVLPGVSPSSPLFLPRPVNQMLFHLMFNRLPTMNVQLVHGREDIFFGFIFDVEASKKPPADGVRVYSDNLGRQPRVPARQLRVLPGVGHYHGAEPAARGSDRLPLLGRVGQISDVVDAILCLESSPYITGEILHIDGGQTASR
jgi:pimeloyl-ACP methyl ester carboxylesterase